METCRTQCIGSNGEKKQSSSPACKHNDDVYGKFQVRNIEYDLLTEFKITLHNVTQPNYIMEYNFGVTDAAIYVEKVLLSGKCSHFTIKEQCYSVFFVHSKHDDYNIWLISYGDLLVILIIKALLW